MQISRQALYRTPKPRRSPQRRPVSDPVDVAIVETAKSYPTDGYRMICCFVRRSLGVAVNRKRVLRVMREQKLIQRRPVEARRRRPGVFKVECPGPALASRHDLDLGRRARLGVSERDHRLLHPRDRRLVAGAALPRRRGDRGDQAGRRRTSDPAGTLTLGTDNGSAFTARSTRLAISALGVTHRRGGYRDPESQAFIESWFRYLKERCVWRNEFETLDQAREVIAAYIDHYHDRPHSRLDYRTPREVRATWDDATGRLQKPRPEPSTPKGSGPGQIQWGGPGRASRMGGV